MAEFATWIQGWRARASSPEWRRFFWNHWIVDCFDGGKNFALHYFGRALPIDACSGLGALFGEIARRFSIRHNPQRRRVGENWALLKKDGSDPARPHRPRDDIWSHTGRVAMEFSVLDRLWKAGRIEVEGAEHIAAAWATGRPVIIMSVHLAGWETIMPSLIGLGHKVTMIYQPEGNRFGHRLLVKSRNRCGVTLVPPWRAGALPAFRALKSRKSVLLIHVDEHVRGRVMAPSFGRPLKMDGNVANVARMAAMCDAIVIPVHGLRKKGAYFRVKYSPPLELVRTADADADLAANVALIDRVIEPVILANLEKWYMLFDFRMDR